MLKICSFSGCKEVVEVSQYERGSPRCKAHFKINNFIPQKRVYRHHELSNGSNLYYSNRWKKLRAQFKARYPTCARCEKLGLVTPAKVVDHIKELSDHPNIDPFDVNNLQSLCQSCHNFKTGEEHRKRERKEKNNGFSSLSDF